MSEMVERMARRMFPEMMANASPSERENAFDLARAALAELREPTEAMIEASRDALKHEVERTPEPHPWQLMKLGGYRFPTAFKARVRWRAMVDEALR